MKALFDKHMELLPFVIGGAAAILIVYLGLPHLLSLMSISSKVVWSSPIEPATLIGIIWLLASIISTFLAYERYRHVKATGDSIFPFALVFIVLTVMWVGALTLLISGLYIGTAAWLISYGLDVSLARVAAAVFILLIIAIYSLPNK